MLTQIINPWRTSLHSDELDHIVEDMRVLSGGGRGDLFFDLCAGVAQFRLLHELLNDREPCGRRAELLGYAAYGDKYVSHDQMGQVSCLTGVIDWSSTAPFHMSSLSDFNAVLDPLIKLVRRHYRDSEVQRYNYVICLRNGEVIIVGIKVVGNLSPTTCMRFLFTCGTRPAQVVHVRCARVRLEAERKRTNVRRSRKAGPRPKGKEKE